jgi:hypothetical protein
MGKRHHWQQRQAKWSSSCRACHLPIDLIRHRDTLKPASLNPGYDSNGNIFVEGDTYIVLTGEVRAKALERGVKLRINHNVTCEARKNKAA